MLFLFFAFAQPATAQPLPRGEPEAQGVSSTHILKWVDALDKESNSVHSFILLRHGKVIAEGYWSPYNADSPHMLFSLSKSFTSTAVGLAIAEGKFKLHDQVVKFFPEEAPAAPSKNLQELRVRDLLMMSTGHHQTDVQDFPVDSNESFIKHFFAMPVVHKPGTHFVYNTPATFMAGAIVQKVSGQKLVEFLQPRLFDPLGITLPRWSETKEGIAHGGYGLNLKTEDIAKFGQLLLQKGNWNGRQIIPAVWVEEATKLQTANGSNPDSDWDQGYGYQFWRCRHNFFRGDGAFGQYCIVMPEQDAVLAITSGTNDLAKVMQLTWDLLLPAFAAQPLPAATQEVAELRAKTANLVLPSPKGEMSSVVGQAVGGKVFTFDSNAMKVESMSLTQSDESNSLSLRVAGREHIITIGHGTWKTSRSDLALSLAPAGRINAVDPIEQPIAAAGAWTSERAYTIDVAFYETPVVMRITMNFTDENSMQAEIGYNVAFGPTTRPVLNGLRR